MLSDRVGAVDARFFIVIETMRKCLMLALASLVVLFVRRSRADAGPSEEPGCRCGLATSGRAGAPAASRTNAPAGPASDAAAGGPPTVAPRASMAAGGTAPASSAHIDEEGCFLPSEWFSRAGRSIWSIQRFAGAQIDSLGHRNETASHVLYYASQGGSLFSLPMLGYDSVLGERITLGIAVGGLVPTSGNALYVEVLGRLGYLVPLSPGLALWGRAGFGSVNGPVLYWFNVQSDLVFLPVASFGFTLGATLDLPLGPDYRPQYRALGAMLGIVFDY